MIPLLDEYDKAKKAIYSHVGFVEDYVVCPLDDCTEMYWALTDTTFYGGKGVKYATSMEQFNSDGDYYEDDIYTQRFYKKHVYEGKDFTMIFCDSHTDGMKWFRIFDNSKKVTK